MTTFETVKNLITEQLGNNPADVTPEAHLEDDLGADLLDFVEIVMAIEEEFNLEIPDNEALDLRDKPVKDIVAYIDRNK